MHNQDPWAWMQPYDVARFGEVIMDRAEQERWCRAVLLGGCRSCGARPRSPAT